MRRAWKVGLSFGTTSGVITTLGLMVGLYAGTNSKSIVLAGILTIAIADAFSDALGIHMSQESQKGRTQRQIWEATIVTLAAKFVVAMVFVIPMILLALQTAMLANIALGFVILCGISYVIAKERRARIWKAIGEHVVVATAVILLTYALGEWLAVAFS